MSPVDDDTYQEIRTGLKAVSILISAIGIAIIGWYSNIATAIGIVLLLWGNNISHKLEDA